MKVIHRPFNLPFQYPFTISKGTKTHQPTLVVQLEFRGVIGYGEAPAISYYNIPLEKMVEDLERKRMMVEKFAFMEPERYWHYLHHLYPANNFLVCALDIAAWDLYGKLYGQPLHRLWQLDPAKAPVTDYTIGIDSIDRMVAKMQARPWPVYKIKLGTPEDIDIVRALRQHTAAVFRVDANAGWTEAEALEKIPLLQELGVELIEQPLAKDNWEGMHRLYQASPIPLIADESCVVEGDVAKCQDHFHGINIKLTKCSGITPARRMISKARSLGLKVMLGSMNESSIGTAALAQLAPLADFLDADGPLLLAEDLASGLEFREGRVVVSDQPGLGIQVPGSPWTEILP
ncbi:MAG: dipeptide epimerase [Candidatus Pseudobacter hemicellulosilyticus]|uniref:Dipeptide epimerase n=1 Tax=Candidatus Pseudobacter hemicellulosilyticus TaxID=3121375 RepID=A0AAJ6BGU1_9BACT|nr:MAG: dipeptide epimerase [Pseudobacter sp.]